MPDRLLKQEALFLTTLRAGRTEGRIALAVLPLSLLLFFALAPFAKMQLAPLWAFIPAYESALIVNDLITAALLLSQYMSLRARSLLVLAAAYLFTALMTVMHALTFPGLFTPGQLRQSGPRRWRCWRRWRCRCRC